MRKLFRYIIRTLLVLLICVFSYFVYIVVWVHNFNDGQRKSVENVAPDFCQTSQIIRDTNGYFGVIATINGRYMDTLLLDTQASTSLAKHESLEKYKAEYWRRKPMPTFNMYRQVYFSKLYKVREIAIGNCNLDGVVFTSVPKDNGMYNSLYRTVLGRTVIEYLGWKFDMDHGKMTMFALDGEELLQREAEGFIRVRDGVNNLHLYSEQTDTLELMLDLGSNYDIVIDKSVYEKLRMRLTPRLYANYRREGLTDTVAEFRGVTMVCGGVVIPDCTLSYIPSIDRNVAGNIFAGKINFILAGDDLYVKQRAGMPQQTVCDGLSPLGLRIGVRGDKVCVTALEVDGPAAKSGLRLGDKIAAVDNGMADAGIMSVSSGKLERHIQQADSLIVEIERDGTRQIFYINNSQKLATTAGR
ncbi:MAG: hypothetical protein C7K11_01495 [Candidatus Amulumruptor caecigallinarius]|nr:MAG: hypothetical protein C7K11_01495 [Candidatus Amulumruptor caecigallinarius]